jgi:hypothetical protein
VTQPPKRWLDSNDESPELRELLEAGETELAPPEVLRRSAGRLSAALGVSLALQKSAALATTQAVSPAPGASAAASASGGAASTGAGAAASAGGVAASATGVGSALGGLLAKVVSAVVVTGTAAHFVVQSSKPAPAATPRAQPAIQAGSSSSAREPARRAPAEAAEHGSDGAWAAPEQGGLSREPGSAAAEAGARDTSAGARAPAHVQRADRARASGRQSAPSASPDPRLLQLQLLERAQAELPRDPQAALALLEEYARQFGGETWLAQECAALSVQALVRSGQLAAARQSFDAFAARYPGSPMLGLLERELAARLPPVPIDRKVPHP